MNIMPVNHRLRLSAQEVKLPLSFGKSTNIHMTQFGSLKF